MAFDMDKIITLLAVTLGWFLNEVGRAFELRREGRRAIAEVLTDLMEIRHNLLAIEKLRDVLSTTLRVPADRLPPVQDWIEPWLPDAKKFAERYEEGVRALARADPILAYRLRSHAIIRPALADLRKLAIAGGEPPNLWGRIERSLVGIVGPHLDELILEVARLHGWITWVRVRHLIRKPLALTSEEERSFARLVELASASGNTPKASS